VIIDNFGYLYSIKGLSAWKFSMGFLCLCFYLSVVVMYTQAMGSKEWREVKFNIRPLLILQIKPFLIS